MGATYREVSLVETAIYLYHDYETGRVDEFLAIFMLREIFPCFEVQNREALQVCKFELHRMLDEDLQWQRAAEDS